MVNRTNHKLSPGCGTCKDDRVKCDRQVPACQRCLRLRIVCPGYADSWDLVHRQYVPADRRNPTREKRMALASKRPARQDHHSSTTPILSRPLDLDVETRGVHVFLEDYSSYSGISVFELVPVLREARRPAACFTSALHAAALASCAARFQHSGLSLQSRQHYNNAISSLRQTMETPKVLEDHSILMALFLLGFYEIFTKKLAQGDLAIDSADCHPHATGVLAIMQFRIARGWNGTVDQGIFTFCRHVHLMDIFTGHATAASLRTEFQDRWLSWKALPSMDPVIERAAELYDELRHVACALDTDMDNTAGLISKAVDVFLSLQDCADQAVWDAERTSPSVTFNGLIKIASATSASVVQSLYLTVALHICESATVFLNNLSNTGIAPKNTQLERMPTPAECGPHIWFRIEALLVSRRDERSKCEPRKPLLAFCLSWPILALAKSQFSGEEKRNEAFRLLQSL